MSRSLCRIHQPQAPAGPTLCARAGCGWHPDVISLCAFVILEVCMFVVQLLFCPDYVCCPNPPRHIRCGLGHWTQSYKQTSKQVPAAGSWSAHGASTLGLLFAGPGPALDLHCIYCTYLFRSTSLIHKSNHLCELSPALSHRMPQRRVSRRFPGETIPEVENSWATGKPLESWQLAGSSAQGGTFRGFGLWSRPINGVSTSPLRRGLYFVQVAVFTSRKT